MAHCCVCEITFNSQIMLTLFLFGQGVPMRLHSLVEYNPLPSAFASQSYGGYNNNRSHTQSE